MTGVFIIASLPGWRTRPRSTPCSRCAAWGPACVPPADRAAVL